MRIFWVRGPPALRINSKFCLKLVIMLCSCVLGTCKFSLKHYDNEIFVDSRITTIEQLVTQIQCSVCKLQWKRLKPKWSLFRSQCNLYWTSKLYIVPVKNSCFSKHSICCSKICQRNCGSLERKTAIEYYLEEYTARVGSSLEQDDIKRYEYPFQSHLGTKVTRLYHPGTEEEQWQQPLDRNKTECLHNKNRKIVRRQT